MSYIVEKDWTSCGLRCVAIAGEAGHRCGYVGLPQGHPLYGVGYGEYSPALDAGWAAVCDSPIGDRGIIPMFIAMMSDNETIKPTPDIFFDVHGSITYAASEADYPVPHDGLWWYGFDCAHDTDAKDFALLTNERLRKVYTEFGNNGIVRDLAFVVAECEKLAAQLAKIK